MPKPARPTACASEALLASPPACPETPYSYSGEEASAARRVADLSSVITKTRAKSIQSPDTPSGLNDVNLWPDTTPASGFWLPTMPTDYDSLDEGENEMQRGRLFF